MPNKDGTGPRGKGPKTGAQEGNCENKTFTEENRPGNGSKRGLRCSEGRNRRNQRESN